LLAVTLATALDITSGLGQHCPSPKEWVFSSKEVLEIDSDEGDMALDTMMVNEDSETSDEDDDERLWDIPVAGPEQEEDNLGDIPEVF
jgi:hypothetical protein